jgi:hypothetical protein
VTPEEAAALYDEILNENGTNYLEDKMFYAASISRFLSDQQIFSLIKVSVSLWMASCKKKALQQSQFFCFQEISISGIRFVSIPFYQVRVPNFCF